MSLKSQRVKQNSRELIEIHPALDFTRNLALVAIPEVRTSFKGGSNSKDPMRKEYYIVTSMRERFPLIDEELFKRGFCSKVNLFIPEARWSVKSVEDFLLGDIKKPSLRRVYFEIKGIYKEYLDYQDKRLYSYLTLWAIGTYFYHLFYAYPINHFGGASGSGKSKTLDLTEKLVFNPINSSNISDASIYRIIESSRATLLLDENEKISQKNFASSQLNLLLAGFKKGAKVYRNEKDKDGNFHPVPYEIYSPKIIANIRGIQEEALKNRTIQFILTPSQSRKTLSYPTGEEPIWQEIRDQLYLCLMYYWQDVIRTKQEVAKSKLGLNGYPFMQWHPILTLAKLVGEKTYNKILSLANEKSRQRSEEVEERPDRKLLVLLYQIFKLGKLSKKKLQDSQFLTTNVIHSALISRLGYGEEEVPGWLSTYAVGKMLSNLNVGRAKLEKVDGKSTRGFWIYRGKLEEAIQRFGLNKKEL